MEKLIPLNRLLDKVEEQGQDLSSILVNPKAVFTTENPDVFSVNHEDLVSPDETELDEEGETDDK